ncbi:hypothetical protein [Methylobacterium brachiatum]|nr:hypothetical protein [Methylobacterium brachiatum]
MIPDEPCHFDQITLLPEDWDEIEDGDLDLAGIKLADLDDSAERV